MSFSNLFTQQNYEKEYLTCMNKRLRKEYSGARSKFDLLQRKCSEKQVWMSSPRTASSEYVRNLKKQLRIYEKERKSVRGLVKSVKSRGEKTDLIRENKEKQERIEKLIKENLRLNKKIENPLNSKVNYEYLIKDAEREISELTEKMNQIEKSRIQTDKLLKIHFETREYLEEKYDSLSKIPLPSPNLVNEQKIHFDLLSKKLKTLKTSRKTSRTKYLYHIKELEKDLESNTKTTYTLKTKIFKKNQQKLLINMSHDEISIKRSQSNFGKRRKIFNPDVSFMYNPSVKRLYY